MLRDDDTSPLTGCLEGEIEVADVLSGLVVVSVGRGGPLQEAVNRSLKAAGAVVLAKTSAAEVVGMLGTFVPSVIVVEIAPGDDEALRILPEILRLPAEHGGGVPLIGVSWDAPDPAPILQAGFHGGLVGPFDAIDVARAILRAVRQRR
jgi:hypothetical protein